MKLAARVIVLVVALLVVCGGSTSAHPLGNFTVNHYVGLDIRGDGELEPPYPNRQLEVLRHEHGELELEALPRLALLHHQGQQTEW